MCDNEKKPVETKKSLGYLDKFELFDGAFKN